MAILTAIAGAAIGALVALLVKHWLGPWCAETRVARREFYVELLTMLRALSPRPFGPRSGARPDKRGSYRRLQRAARARPTVETRGLVAACFRLLDAQHGLFHYRTDRSGSHRVGRAAGRESTYVS